MSEGGEATEPATVGAPVAGARPNGRDVAWIIGGVALGYVVGALLFLALLHLVHGSRDWKGTTGFTAGAYLAQALILTLPVVLIGVGWRGIPWRDLGFRRPAGRWWPIALLGCVLMIGVAETLDRTLGSPLAEQLTSALAPEGFSWRSFTVMLIVAGMIAPFGEEILFRGLLFHWLRGRWGWIAATLGTAILFGAVHFDPYWAAQAGAFGLFFAFLVEKSGSIWPAYLGHVLINMTGVAMLYGTL